MFRIYRHSDRYSVELIYVCMSAGIAGRESLPIEFPDASDAVAHVRKQERELGIRFEIQFYYNGKIDWN